MTTTAKLGIPFISGQQNQPEITHNTAVMMLQAMALGAKAIQNAPPGSPADGDVYIVGTAGSGAWGGHNNRLAIFLGGWHFLPGVDSDGATLPMDATVNGLSVFLQSAGVRYVWLNPNWEPEAAPVSGGGGGATDLASLSDVNVSETTGQDGYVLTWDEASGFWIAAPVESPSSGDASIPLTNGHILVGDASNIATDRAVSGDAVISNTGVVTVSKAGGVAFGSAAFQSAASFDAAGAAAAAAAASDPVGSSAAVAALRAAAGVFGLAKVDGTTITAAAGVLSAVAALPAALLFIATSSALQTMVSGAWAKAIFDTFVTNSLGTQFDVATSKFTPTKAGKYLVFSSLRAAVTGGGVPTYLTISITKNGTWSGSGTQLAFATLNEPAVVNNNTGTPFAFSFVDMNGSSDYVEVDANAGATSTVKLSNGQCFFGALYIGP